MPKKVAVTASAIATLGSRRSRKGALVHGGVVQTGRGIDPGIGAEVTDRAPLLICDMSCRAHGMALLSVASGLTQRVTGFALNTKPLGLF